MAKVVAAFDATVMWVAVNPKTTLAILAGLVVLVLVF